MPNGGPDNCMNCEHSGSDDIDIKSIRAACSIRGATIVLPSHTYCKNFTSQERGVSGGDVPLGPIWIDVTWEDLPSAPYTPGSPGGFRCPVPDWGKYHLIRGSGNLNLLDKFLKEQLEKYQIGDWEKKKPGKVPDDFREGFVNLVEELFFDAIDRHADEILFEPGEEEAAVNLITRTDKQKLAAIPMSQFEDILFLIKAKAGLDTESNLTQRGGFGIRVKDKSFEATVTTELFSSGEKIAVKLEAKAPPEEETSNDDNEHWLEDLGSSLDLDD